MESLERSIATFSQWMSRQQGRLIRKLIGVPVRVWKMPLQNARDSFNTKHRAQPVIRPPEGCFNLSADGAPCLFALVRMNASVGDDLNRVVRHQDVDQDTIVLLGVPHSKQ